MERYPKLNGSLIPDSKIFSLLDGKNSKVATCLLCSQETLYVDDKEEGKVSTNVGFGVKVIAWFRYIQQHMRVSKNLLVGIKKLHYQSNIDILTCLSRSKGSCMIHKPKWS